MSEDSCANCFTPKSIRYHKTDEKDEKDKRIKVGVGCAIPHLTVEAIFNDMLMNYENNDGRIELRPILTIDEVLTICSEQDDESGRKQRTDLLTDANLFSRMGAAIEKKYLWMKPQQNPGAEVPYTSQEVVSNIKHMLGGAIEKGEFLNQEPSKDCQDAYPIFDVNFQRPFEKKKKDRQKTPNYQLYFYVQLFNISDIDTVNQVR